MTKTRNLISLVAITLALTAPVAAQKKAKIPSDPEVATKLKALKSIAGDKKFTQDAKGIEIIEGLRGHTSGYAIPQFVVDGPGGGGKIPINPQYIVEQNDERTVLRNYEGKEFIYPEASKTSNSLAH